MTQPQSTPRLENWVHWTLLAGVVVSGALLILGLVLLFASHDPRPPGPPPGLATLVREAATGNGLSIVDLALLLLMATPLARVAVLAAGWAVEGNRRFALVALTVLGLLALSLWLGVG